MLDKPLVPGFTTQQPRYQPLHNFTYWALLGCFNKCNITTFSHKAATSEAFEETHQVFLDDINNITTLLLQSIKYGDINTKDYKKRAIVLLSLSNRYTLYMKKIHAIKNCKTGEMDTREYYLRCMQENTKWYWDQKMQHQAIVVPTCTIVHPWIDVMVMKHVHDIPRSF